MGARGDLLLSKGFSLKLTPMGIAVPYYHPRRLNLTGFAIKQELEPSAVQLEAFQSEIQQSHW